MLDIFKVSRCQCVCSFDHNVDESKKTVQTRPDYASLSI